MNPTDFHLYIIFKLDQQFFGININNINKLYRLSDNGNQTSYTIVNQKENKQTVLNMINLKETLFAPVKHGSNQNNLNYHQFKMPTLIELISPVPDSTIQNLGIVVDFVVGMHQIPPDDFTDSTLENTIQKSKQLPVLNGRFIMGHVLIPIMDRKNQTIDTPVSLIHVKNLFVHGVKMKIN